MHVQNKLDILCKFIKYTLALFLLVVSIVLSKDVLDQYTSKATSYKQNEQDITQDESITLSFAFWPLKKTDYPSSVPFQAYEQWKFGKDFTLRYGVLSYRSAQEVINLEEDRENYEISHSSIGKIQFTMLVTKYGKYYKISANMINVKSPNRVFINIEFDKSVATENLPDVEIIMSSEENALGLQMASPKGY